MMHYAIPNDWLLVFPLLVIVEEVVPRLGFILPPLLLEGCVGDNNWALSLSRSLPGRNDSSNWSTLSSVTFFPHSDLSILYPPDVSPALTPLWIFVFLNISLAVVLHTRLEQMHDLWKETDDALRCPRFQAGVRSQGRLSLYSVNTTPPLIESYFIVIFQNYHQRINNWAVCFDIQWSDAVGQWEVVQACRVLTIKFCSGSYFLFWWRFHLVRLSICRLRLSTVSCKEPRSNLFNFKFFRNKI